MKPYDENIQTFAVMFSGYDQALSRLESAVKEKEPTSAFVALFEALNWAVALDDRAREHWTPEGKALGFGWRGHVRGAHLMQAVRFARRLRLSSRLPTRAILSGARARGRAAAVHLR